MVLAPAAVAERIEWMAEASFRGRPRSTAPRSLAALEADL
jgi:hypothetical protein